MRQLDWKVIEKKTGCLDVKREIRNFNKLDFDMLRPIPFIEYPHLNVEADIRYPAWLVRGLIYADPGYPGVTNLVWGVNVIGRWIDEFSEVAEKTLETEHFSIELGLSENGEMQTVLTHLGPDESTIIHLGGIGHYLYMNQGEQYSLRDEILIEAGERYFVFKVNPSWKKWAKKGSDQ